MSTVCDGCATVSTGQRSSRDVRGGRRHVLTQKKTITASSASVYQTAALSILAPIVLGSVGRLTTLEFPLRTPTITTTLALVVHHHLYALVVDRHQSLHSTCLVRHVVRESSGLLHACGRKSAYVLLTLANSPPTADVSQRFQLGNASRRYSTAPPPEAKKPSNLPLYLGGAGQLYTTSCASPAMN